MARSAKPKKNVAAETAPSSGPRSLTRVLGLFDILADHPQGMTLANLSEALSSPKSSLLNLFRPLVAEDYLCHENGYYKLGPSLYRLSSKIMSTWNFAGLVHPYISELASLTGETVYLGVLDKNAALITYVDVVESPHSIRYPIKVGTTRPLYCTAAGRVLLAFEDPKWVDNYLKTVSMDPLTAKTITDRRKLRKLLDDVRENNMCVSYGELFDELGAASAPIFGANGKIVAAIAIGSPVSKLRSDMPSIKTHLLAIAARASGTG